jgi:hypothetical protein
MFVTARQDQRGFGAAPFPKGRAQLMERNAPFCWRIERPPGIEAKQKAEQAPLGGCSGLLRRMFGRRQGVQAQGMDRTGQFFGQGGIDQALAGHAVQAFKAPADHTDGKMTLAPFPCARMSTMFGAVVMNLQLLRGKSLVELRPQAVGYDSHILPHL